MERIQVGGKDLIEPGGSEYAGVASETLSPRSEVLDRLAAIACEALQTTIGIITLGEGDAVSANSQGSHGDSPTLAADPLAAELMAQGTLIAICEPTTSDRALGAPDGFRSYLGAPVRNRDGSVFGVLAVLDEHERVWTDRERSLLTHLADSAAAEIVAQELAIELEGANAKLDKTRSELIQERLQLREMIRTAPAFMACIEGPEGIFTMANEPFFNLVGGRELIGRPLHEALPELAGQGVFEMVARVLSECKPHGASESRIRLRQHPDGELEERFVNFVYQPLIGLEWNATGVLVCGVDLTEQVRARKAAEAAGADFRLMAETIHQVFWAADATGSRLLYVSPAVERVWGITRAEIIASNGWRHTILEDDRERVDAQFTPERLQGGGYDAEYRILRFDGSIRWVRDRAYPVRNDAGDIYRIVGIAEDTTERRTLEMELRQSQKMEAVGRLAGGIAHDFNNMLTAITGHTQLLEMELPPSSPLHEHLSIIHMAADRSADLTRQLLAFSRKQILQPQVIDLNHVVGNMEPMLTRMIGEDIELRTSLQPGLAPIFADRGQIEQVLMNLVVNARDALVGGGKLMLRTTEADLTSTYFASHHVEMRPGRYAVLSVSDTGVGMDRVTQARIFEPFFTTKPAGKGTGLGLSTVYGIVKQTEGFVWVYAEPGQGSTFKVYLPLAPHRQPADPQQIAVPEDPVQGTTVLVVEDDPSVRRLVLMVLQRAGYTVLTADGGKSAMAALTAVPRPIDLLLTDVVLPLMSGRQISEMVLELYPDTPVLFMSGYTDEAIVHHGVLDPGTEFLEKPFTPELLLAKIDRVLRKKTGL